MYNDYCLRFPDEATQKQFYDVTEDTTIDVFPNLHWDVIGVIQKPTGTMLTDDEGEEYPEKAPVEGWHANIRCVGALPAALQEYEIHPTNPVRVFY